MLWMPFAIFWHRKPEKGRDKKKESIDTLSNRFFITSSLLLPLLRGICIDNGIAYHDVADHGIVDHGIVDHDIACRRFISC